MILVFGGTTEGRKAVEVLEEAGSGYCYSTRGEEQEVELVHGQRLTGGMDVDEMMACCREYGIRLIVDAAHPFATELHRNLLLLAEHVGVPVIRYDRIYPQHNPDITWCKDYEEAIAQLEAQGIDRLLALTGVNTISKMRPYWQGERTDGNSTAMRHECWFRILKRSQSQMLARKAQFPEDHLVYYEEKREAAGWHGACPYIDEGTRQLLKQLKPQAILTKESGLSGGFTEKVVTAKAAGVKVFAVERPPYPPVALDVHIEYVNGPYGLRRAVERLLPEFFPLKSGLTTGTCATAAAVAAMLQMQMQRSEALPTTVTVILPDGETITVPVGYGDGYAYCVKEAGDDPDVTNGLEIRATVEMQPGGGQDIVIKGGEGVGTFTLPGFDFPPGEPAINKGPRAMIRQNIRALANTQHPTPSTQHPTPNTQHPAPNTQHPTPNTQHPTPSTQLTVTISVPQGAEIAKRTFNPRLGIEGGISIIGVSGIVKPFSEEAFIDSIRKCMEVAKASFTGIANPREQRVVINSGAKSERFVKARYPDLPRQAFVEYGNYIGATLTMAHELGFPQVTLGVMLGKAVKLAEGHLDTHSRKTTMNLAFIRQMLAETGIDIDLSDITLARELWERIPEGRLADFARTVIRHCEEWCKPLLPGGTLTILLIDDNGKIYN